MTLKVKHFNRKTKHKRGKKMTLDNKTSAILYTESEFTTESALTLSATMRLTKDGTGFEWWPIELLQTTRNK
ncbi:hypothetical protein CEXT_431421 [Caerostris extrusa]|uniref:Uncharacterized protein n=1 Tax=Caerostris extrusa TaxID=172846 RepID=A0AAV4TRG7_CAEEX|nr:hypothetical protein CEXT_431421 [Caerostris extrusa]